MTYSLEWSAVRVLLFGALIWLCIWIAFFDTPHETNGRYRWLSSLNVETGGTLFSLIFGACGIWFCYYLVITIWQFFSNQPAVALDSRAVLFHRSFTRAPDVIPLADIQSLVFARADKLPKSAGQRMADGLPGKFGVRLGRKCRSGLRIYYRTDRQNKYVTIDDNLVEGGQKALLEFGASLRLLLRSKQLL